MKAGQKKWEEALTVFNFCFKRKPEAASSSYALCQRGNLDQPIKRARTFGSFALVQERNPVTKIFNLQFSFSIFFISHILIS